MKGLVKKPVSEIGRGLSTYLKGIGWLRRNKRYCFLLLVPMCLGFLMLVTSWQLFFSYETIVLDWIYIEKSEGFFSSLFYYTGLAFIYLGLLLLSFLLCFLTSNILSAPVYELISIAVEKEMCGGSVHEMSFWDSLKLIKEELKKSLFILAISIVLLLIPGINLLIFVSTAFLLGWEFFDYPLARRGWGFRKRLGFVLKDFWSVTSFGLWLVIPFAQFILIPLAVAGGTQLCLTSLKQ